jgi:hypothetical protein
MTGAAPRDDRRHDVSKDEATALENALECAPQDAYGGCHDQDIDFGRVDLLRRDHDECRG